MGERETTAAGSRSAPVRYGLLGLAFDPVTEAAYRVTRTFKPPLTAPMMARSQ
jgi:hypothetical protein